MDTSESSRTPTEPRSRHMPRPCWSTAGLAGQIGIVVDVSAFSLFSAAGIVAALRAGNHQPEDDRDLLLRAPPPLAWRVLEVGALAGLAARPGRPRFGPGRRTGNVATGARGALSTRSLNGGLG
jgi:hypothetical protein